MFRSIILLKPDELSQAYFLCILKIAPDYKSLELGVGNETIMKAIASSCGKSVKVN